MLTIITYDITDNSRREHVSSELKNYGMRVQKSVFECYMDNELLSKLKASLETMIDATADHVRFYPLCKKDLEMVKVEGIQIIYRDEDYFLV